MVGWRDVVLVAFPYTDGSRGKVRPALVVQNDRNNQRLQNTIIAMISGNIQRAEHEPTQFLLDPDTPEGKTSGLFGPSAVKCENLFTIAQNDILRGLGSLSPTQLTQVDACQRSAIGPVDGCGYSFFAKEILGLALRNTFGNRRTSCRNLSAFVGHVRQGIERAFGNPCVPSQYFPRSAHRMGFRSSRRRTGVLEGRSCVSSVEEVAA
jgi:mRNA interferase MazF